MNIFLFDGKTIIEQERKVSLMKKINLSEKNLKNTLYIGAGIMAVTVVFLSVFAVVQSNSSKKNTLPTQSSSTSEITKPTVDTNKNDDFKDPDKELGDNKGENVGVDVVPDKDKETHVFVMPCTGSISKYHSPDELLYSLTMNDYRPPEGIDIACKVGDEVFAVCAGTIQNVYYDPLMGYCVSIDHGKGMVTTYKNLSEEMPENVVEGAKVVMGQKIGAVGESAIIEVSDAAHLHIEMTENNVSVDPLEYIPFDEDVVFEG